MNSYCNREVIRGHLDIPKGRSGANHLIRGILEILEVEGAVEYNPLVCRGLLANHTERYIGH